MSKEKVFCDNCNDYKSLGMRKFVKGLDDQINEFNYCEECVELLERYNYPICCECGKILTEEDDYERFGDIYICGNCFYVFDDVFSKDEFPKKDGIENYTILNQPNGKWETEINVIEPEDFEVIVPEDLLKLCKSIEYNLKDSVEFSILVKGEFKDARFEVNADDYVIPLQEVSGGSVDYKENLLTYIEKGYNVHLHRHPSTIKTFSDADEKSTNVNFDCALLYCEGNITDASLRFKLNEDTYLKIKPKIKMKLKLFDDITGIENIKKRTYSVGKTIYHAL